MSGTEIVFLLVLAIVVVGPKRLPTMMRKAGQWIAKIRRMTMDVRENTGIDRIIREEGLEKEIRELSNLTRSPMFRTMMNLSPGALVANALAQSAPASAAASPAKPITSSTAVTSPLGPSTEVGSILGPAKSASDASSAPLQGGLPSSSTVSSAASLIKPAEGSVARGSDQAMAALTAAGFFSFREREYPTIGCDAYDALPDDLDDPDAYPLEPPPEEPSPSMATTEANASLGTEPIDSAPSPPPATVDPSSSEEVATASQIEAASAAPTEAKKEEAHTVSTAAPEGLEKKTEAAL